MATVADVYGTQIGPTWDQSFAVGGMATTSDTTNGGISAPPAQMNPTMHSINVAPGVRISPLVGALVLVVALLGLKFLHEWKRADSDFAELKIGVVSFVTVTLMACGGIPLVRGLLTRYNLPGVSDYVVGGI